MRYLEPTKFCGQIVRPLSLTLLPARRSIQWTLRTLEHCRLDIEGLGRELLAKPRPRVARELKHVCRLLQKRVIASQKYGNVVDPLVRIADAAARLERQSTDALASYDLKEALQSLAKILVDYHVRS